MDILDCRPGLMVIKVGGNNAQEIFKNESGGHRWQRVPPNERHDRVHTSTITVSVLTEPNVKEFVLLEKDLEIRTCRGSGDGGQKKNKTESAVMITHTPTKTMVRCDCGRSQHQNKQLAIDLLRTRLYAIHATKAANSLNNDRKNQIGSGMRGDKRRTIRCQHNVVVDHVTEQTWDLHKYFSGNW